MIGSSSTSDAERLRTANLRTDKSCDLSIHSDSDSTLTDLRPSLRSATSFNSSSYPLRNSHLANGRLRQAPDSAVTDRPDESTTVIQESRLTDSIPSRWLTRCAVSSLSHPSQILLHETSMPALHGLRSITARRADAQPQPVDESLDWSIDYSCGNDHLSVTGTYQSWPLANPRSKYQNYLRNWNTNILAFDR